MEQPAPRSLKAAMGEYLREVRGEVHKVAWPTRNDALHDAKLVVVCVVVAIVVLAAFEGGLTRAVSAFFG